MAGVKRVEAAHTGKVVAVQSTVAQAAKRAIRGEQDMADSSRIHSVIIDQTTRKTAPTRMAPKMAAKRLNRSASDPGTGKAFTSELKANSKGRSNVARTSRPDNCAIHCAERPGNAVSQTVRPYSVPASSAAKQLIHFMRRRRGTETQ